MTESPLQVELAVVGAGPAGLAAAVAAAEAGLSVALVDAGRRPGGQYWRQPAAPAESGTPGERGHFQQLQRRLGELRATGRLTYLPERQVWFLDPADSYVLHLAPAHDGPEPGGPRVIRAAAVVAAPGGYDRQLPIPGWDLPGVLAAGGLQALLKAHGVAAGRRAVVAGTGPFLLPVATGLAAAGVEVVAVCEASSPTSWLRRPLGVVGAPSKLVEGAGYAAALARHRIPYRIRTVVSRIHGATSGSGGAVEAVTLSRVDATGRVIPGHDRREEVDLVGLGWGFTPSLELPLSAGAETRVDVDGSLVVRVDTEQRSSRPGLYVAGEATGVGGARLAVLEGELAGLTVAADRGGAPDRRRLASLRRNISRARNFAVTMHRAHPVPRDWSAWLDADTIVCRCEEVTAGEILQARDDLGAGDPRTVKLLARPGMGWCQGRVCGFATACLSRPDGTPREADLRALASRPIGVPVALDALADLDASPDAR